MASSAGRRARVGRAALDELIETGDPADLLPPAARARRHPHERDDRHAEGREPPPARVAGSRRRAARGDPAARPRAHDDRGADVPLVGLRPPRARDRAGVDARPAPALRRRRDPPGDRRSRRDGARRRAGDAAADARARRARDRPPRPRRAARHRRQRLRAAGRARDARHGRLRRRALQPLRLDGGRVGDGRHAAGPARGARHRGPPAARHGRAPLRRRRPRGRARRDGQDLRRQRDGVRGLHRGRRQADAATGCWRPATSGTSTPKGGCSSTAAPTR